MSDDEFTLRRQMDRAAKAATLLENETLVQAFEELRATYIGAWEASPARDTEGRERLWQAVKLIETVRAHLGMLVNDGVLASSAVNNITKPTVFG